ncbi:5'-3' exoribonuclease 2 [Polyplax serrata]|uniref:5'-3' exoribonuclease n=1 Tax=Polyplax serrata TaxID=468196 RepID=A0ABR1AFQ8_POLSC
MGVPAFFRWLSRKYPSVIVYCVEEKPKDIDGVKVPVDSSQPNPNGVEFDNLYLDMNGIIHPCTHPEDKPAPKSEDEMMIAIFECIDRLFSIVRPRKLLYMAIDGVAPRAKMNQQRSRRFRASKETVEKIEEVSRLREELLNKGAYLPPEKSKEAHFDSNCITPGTPFMDHLSVCLDYYIHDRLNNDPAWKGIKVILSDASVPGEGEHKIMDFIRRQRAQPDHDPNTQHVLCGADADLIMLGLATHEPNFTIIREEFRANKPRPCDLCNQLGHDMHDCVGCPKPVDGGLVDVKTFGEEIPFIFVRLSVLREYLEKELMMPGLPFKYDFERVIDDWVFMCFFVGNDFLPHLPSLEIREGAIDRLVNLYKDCVYKTGGFVTDSGDVNLNRVQLILNELGKVEDEIFKNRHQTELDFKQRNANRKRAELQNKDNKPSWIPGGQFAPTPLGLTSQPSVIQNPRHAAAEGRKQCANLRLGLEAMLRPQKRKDESQELEQDKTIKGDIPVEEEETSDEVRLWEDGFKDRYYESKFDVGKDDINFRIKVAHEYVRGLCWVLRYYYQGCACWKWFFPYHYAPFASDFVNVGSLSTEFAKGSQPFRPLEQLMGVFPAASSSHVPKPWATLMHDPFSPIIDFYPVDFKIDLNGKKFAWQGVALLPFVDETRLFKALEAFYDKLTPAERKRNTRGDDKVYIGMDNTGYTFLKGLYDSQKEETTEEEFNFCFDGVQGKILLSKDFIGHLGTLASPIRNLPHLRDNVVVSARFRDPKYSSDFVFKAKRLKGAVQPQRVLKPGDLTFAQNRNWRPQIGMAPATDRAFLAHSGHRMLHHYNRNQGVQNAVLVQSAAKESYKSVPPSCGNRFNRWQPYQVQQAYGYSTVGRNNNTPFQGNYSRYSNHYGQRDNNRFQPNNNPRGQRNTDGRFDGRNAGRRDMNIDRPFNKSCRGFSRGGGC